MNYHCVRGAVDALREANGIGERVWQWMAYRARDRRLVLTSTNTSRRKLFLVFHDPLHVRLQDSLEVYRFELAGASEHRNEPAKRIRSDGRLEVLLVTRQAVFSITCRDLTCYEWQHEGRV